MTSVVIPDSVATIWDSAFQSCSNLTGVFFSGNAPTTVGFGIFTGNAVIYRLPGTSGWGATFAGQPVVLWNPQFLVDDASFGLHTNRFGFTITGTADIPIVLEACADLAHPQWQLLQSCSLTNGSIYFGDSAWTNYSARFYRIRSP